MERKFVITNTSISKLSPMFEIQDTLSLLLSSKSENYLRNIWETFQKEIQTFIVTLEN